MLVALCRRRVSAAGAARLGWVLSVLVVGIGVALGASMGARADRIDLLAGATRWLLWLSLAPAAWAIAADRALKDKGDGVELLAALHGVARQRLDRARVLAAAMEGTLRTALPVAIMAGSVLVMSLQWRVAVLGGAVTVVAASTGASLCTLASACGHLARERGRLLFSAIVLLPWALSDALPVAPLSIPGALDAALGALCAVVASDGGGVISP